jgi:hypothetical protein
MQVELEAVLDRLAEEVVEAVRGHGLEELRNKRWAELEGPAVEVGDAVTRKVLARLLGQQAEELVGGDAAGGRGCPFCTTELAEKPRQTRSLVTRRGTVHWKTPVGRCTRCRRDFFPSGEGVGD